MRFSEQIVYAMFDPRKYKELLELKKRRFVLFVVVICLVLGIINYVIPTAAFIAHFGGFEELFKHKIGNISYENGELKDDIKYELSFNSMHFLINTDEERVADEQKKKDGVYVTFGSKYAQMSSVADGDVYNYQTFGYVGMLKDGFDNEALCKFIPTIYVYLVFMFITSCIGYFIKYAVCALVLAFLVGSIRKRLELTLTFGEMFKVCFYGETFGLLLSNFNAALGLLPTFLVSLVSIFISVRMVSTSIILLAKSE